MLEVTEALVNVLNVADGAVDVTLVGVIDTVLVIVLVIVLVRVLVLLALLRALPSVMLKYLLTK